MGLDESVKQFILCYHLGLTESVEQFTPEYKLSIYSQDKNAKQYREQLLSSFNKPEEEIISLFGTFESYLCVELNESDRRHHSFIINLNPKYPTSLLKPNFIRRWREKRIKKQFESLSEDLKDKIINLYQVYRNYRIASTNKLVSKWQSGEITKEEYNLLEIVRREKFS